MADGQDRDIHFAQSAQCIAKRLAKEIEFPNYFWGLTIPEWREEATKILAQYAYDLVKHTLENASHIDLDRLSVDEQVLKMPDIEGAG